MKTYKHSHTLAIGITGGIGRGKTEAAKIFQRLGGQVLFADDIARDVVNSNQTVKRKIQNVFGRNTYKDGLLDRKKMALIAFHNQKSRKKLDGIVHPHVLKFIKDEIVKAKSSRKKSLIFVEAALIFEAHAERLFDYIVVVTANKQKSIERVMKRDNATQKEVLRRIGSQMATSDKVARADFILENDGSKALLERNCRFLFELLLSLTQKND